jgi:4'-phosphopantetheinyl transferase
MNNIKMIDLYLAYTRLTYPEIESYRQKMADYFCLDEQVEYSRFKIPKRQNEWISSRIITKKLISQILTSGTFGFTNICIRKETGGRPYIFMDGQGRLGGGFSLSHSNGFVFCGYSPSFALNYGLDLEKIEERKLEFIEDYFTPQEIEKYIQTGSDHKNDYTTLIWSAKEATLKALGKGLAIDTRKVEVIPLDGKPEFEGWNSCDVVINSGVEKGYKVLWQETGGFIRTISFPAGEPVRLMELDLK